MLLRHFSLCKREFGQGRNNFKCQCKSVYTKTILCFNVLTTKLIFSENKFCKFTFVLTHLKIEKMKGVPIVSFNHEKNIFALFVQIVSNVYFFKKIKTCHESVFQKTLI